MYNKNVLLSDSMPMYDSIKNPLNRVNSDFNSSKLKTEITMTIHGETVPLWTLSNMVTVSGGAFTARSHFALSNPEITPSYDSSLEGFESISSPDSILTPRICLFAVGINGCGAEVSQVKPVVYNSWIDASSIVPFKFENSDIDDASKKIYFGHCTPASGKHAYYFKSFDTAPTLVQKFLDGTTATSANIYQNVSSEVQTYVECKLKISSSDCRSFFANNTASAKINTISLLYATPIIKSGLTYYKDIRPVTKLNFPNESLADTEKGLDITYKIFY